MGYGTMDGKIREKIWGIKADMEAKYVRYQMMLL